MSAPLLIADVPWLLYRAFFALPDSIVDGEGRPVNALLGTVNALLAAIEARPPRAVAACFGRGAGGVPRGAVPAYHAHRDPMPPELGRAVGARPGLLASLGWTVAQRGAGGGRRDVLLRGARGRGAADGRCCSPATATSSRRSASASRCSSCARTATPVEVGPEQVRERYGVGPEQVADFIALRGDPSDGLPGAPGIGAKTARDLLQRHGSLEGALRAVQRSPTAERPRTVGGAE